MTACASARLNVVGVVVCVFVAGAATASPVFLGPTPYLSAIDSPFNGTTFSYFYLEDFEDGLFNAAGASTNASSLVLTPGTLTDSVDGDDGAIDGSGNGGYSLLVMENSLTIMFDPTALGGALPTHVGIVWTDVGNSSDGTGFGQVSISGLDGGGIALGAFGPFLFGDGALGGQTPEDRFIGINNPGGISQFTISMNSSDWEVDHFQYGAASMPVPEPTTLVLLMSGLGVLSARRR